MKPTRNFWPCGILAAFALFISGTAVLIAIACTHKNDLVSNHYYEDEVRFQSQLDRTKRAQQPDSTARVTYDDHSRRITLSLPAGHARSAPRGRVQLYRPAEAGLDRHVELRVDASGAQTIDVADLKAGLWKIRITWTAGGEEFFVDQQMIVGAKRS